MTTTCDHTMQPLSDEETGDIRRQTRTGRPNGAWLEGVSRCSKCGGLEAKVSWYGQIHTTVVVMQDGNPSVRWPTHQSQSLGGAMGMGQ
jgi:hypothetical protein